MDATLDSWFLLHGEAATPEDNAAPVLVLIEGRLALERPRSTARCNPARIYDV